MINNVTLNGRLVKNPELKSTKKGKPVLWFRLAVQQNYASDTGEYGVDFINVRTWGKTAEFVQRNFRKGVIVGVEGKLSTVQKKDKTEYTFVDARLVAFAGYNKSGEDNLNSERAVYSDDDYPF